MTITLSTFFVVIHTSFSLVGISLNGLLSYLAIFQSPAVMKSYSVIVLNVALTNFGACFCNFMMQQRLIPFGFQLFYISYGPCNLLGEQTCFNIYSAMLHFHSHSLWLLLVAFGYRYYVMLHEELRRSRLQLAIFVVYSPSLLMMLVLFMDFSNPESIISRLENNFPMYNLTGLTITSTTDIRRYAPMFTIIHLTLASPPIFIGILYFRWKIIKRLTFKGVDMTSATRNLHAQLLRALTLQATIPVFYLLAVACYFLLQFNIYRDPVIEFLVFVFFLMVPILTPISSLYYVTPYRKFVKRLLAGGKKNNLISNQSTSVITVAI